MTDPPDSFEGLPEVLAEVARVAGLETALTLAKSLGGSRVHVARNPRKRTLLVEAVGMEAARKIARLYGGETILVPLGPAATPLGRRRQMVELIDAGFSVEQIARRMGVHRSSVQRAAAASRARRQPNLFD